jgi:formylglycine-generating enzyme required for sulfatase activity
MRRPVNRRETIKASSALWDATPVRLMPLWGRAAAVLLAALGLHLPACTHGGVEGRAAPTTSTAHRVTWDWYEVVSQEPGSEVTDAAMRRKIEESGQPWKVRDRVTGIELVLVMPGEFLMGSPESEPDRWENEGPQHRVRLTRAFYLGATEVTQAQWRRVLGVDRGFFPGEGKPADGSWDDLQAFLAKANEDVPAGGEHLRAPTEAEWEYACRAGTTGPFSFEGPVGHDVLNHNDGVVRSPYVDGGLKVVDGRLEVEWETPASPGCRMTTAPAGSLPPNAWGLHEMHGNLREFTADAYVPDAYLGRGALAVDPIQRAVGDEARTLRGGDWYKSARFSRSAMRDEGGTHAGSNRLGFRVARTLVVDAPPRLRFEHGVRSILEDSRGNFWFGTTGHFASRYDGESLRKFTEDDGLASKEITSIYTDRRCDLWLGGDGVSKFSGESFDRIH